MRTWRNTRRSLGLQNPGRFSLLPKLWLQWWGDRRNASMCPHGAKHAPGSGLRRERSQSWKATGKAGNLLQQGDQQSLGHAHALQQPLSHACCFTSPSQRACRLLLWPGESIPCRQGDSRQCYFQFSWHTARPPQIAPIIMTTTCIECFLHAKHRSASGQQSS